MARSATLVSWFVVLLVFVLNARWLAAAELAPSFELKGDTLYVRAEGQTLQFT